MTRPKCRRTIEAEPFAICFRPEGNSSHDNEAVIMTLDEYEALRLADLEGLYQEDCAIRMNISRQTFGRILCNAHAKIADVLVYGKTLKIEGGTVSLGTQEERDCDKCDTPLKCCSPEHGNGSCTGYRIKKIKKENAV